jgi:hypothetical protein
MIILLLTSIEERIVVPSSLKWVKICQLCKVLVHKILVITWWKPRSWDKRNCQVYICASANYIECQGCSVGTEEPDGMNQLSAECGTKSEGRQKLLPFAGQSTREERPPRNRTSETLQGSPWVFSYTCNDQHKKLPYSQKIDTWKD